LFHLSRALPEGNIPYSNQDDRPLCIVEDAQHCLLVTCYSVGIAVRVEFAVSDALRIEAVRRRSELKRFLAVPFRVYAGDPCWVPPLTFERLRHLDPGHNPFFANAEAAFWTALQDGMPVGRISAQIDRRHLDRYGDGAGFFGCIDAIDDPAVFDALFRTAETWLAGRGCRRALGPFSLSINDESGLLIDGFDTPPMLMMGHARPYFHDRISELGYRKAKDLLAYAYDFTRAPTPAFQRFVDKAAAESRLRFRAIDMRRYDAEIATVVDIFNDAWAENWGFLPFTHAEMRHLATTLKPLISAGDVAIGEVDGDAAAMAITVPNINEAIADLNGRLLPFGWLRLLWRLKVERLETVRLPLMGVRRCYQRGPFGTALTAGVIGRLRRYHVERGTKMAELSWILEDNRPMRTLIEMFGSRLYKTYRVFVKELAA
jgi:hypothetical protein